jgi:hypothetical protein
MTNRLRRATSPSVGHQLGAPTRLRLDGVGDAHAVMLDELGEEPTSHDESLVNVEQRTVRGQQAA